jgi:hypothetical protein
MGACQDKQTRLRIITLLFGVIIGGIFTAVLQWSAKRRSEDYFIADGVLVSEGEAISLNNIVELALEELAKRGDQLPEKGASMNFEVVSSGANPVHRVIIYFQTSADQYIWTLECSKSGKVISYRKGAVTM